jgi:hypothetical protein
MVLAPDKRARQAAQSRASNQQRPGKSTPTAKAEGGPESPAGSAAEDNGASPAGEPSGISEVAASTEEG